MYQKACCKKYRTFNFNNSDFDSITVYAVTEILLSLWVNLNAMQIIREIVCY